MKGWNEILMNPRASILLVSSEFSFSYPYHHSILPAQGSLICPAVPKQQGGKYQWKRRCQIHLSTPLLLVIRLSQFIMKRGHMMIYMHPWNKTQKWSSTLKKTKNLSISYEVLIFLESPPVVTLHIYVHGINSSIFNWTGFLKWFPNHIYVNQLKCGHLSSL